MLRYRDKQLGNHFSLTSFSRNNIDRSNIGNALLSYGKVLKTVVLFVII